MGYIYKDGKYYVTKEKDKLYYVWIYGITHGVLDSAYKWKELAISRCKYLAKEKL